MVATIEMAQRVRAAALSHTRSPVEPAPPPFARSTPLEPRRPDPDVTAAALPSDDRPASGRELTLLERVAAGDKQAVPLLIDAYGPLLWSIARRQIGVDAAEDLVQEVFIQIWKHAARFDPARASEATYLTTIARRRIIDQRRKTGRQPDHEPICDESRSEDDTLEAVDRGDEARLAERAMAQLAPVRQRVLRMAIVDGLTHTQIAEITKLPLGTVKSHARRGLERVRALLQEDRDAEGSTA